MRELGEYGAVGTDGSLTDNLKENSYLLESLVRFKTSNYAWTRMENAGRSNELINGANPLPAGFQEGPIGHVAAYTFGYDRDVDLVPRLRLGRRCDVWRAGCAAGDLRIASLRHVSLLETEAVFGEGTLILEIWWS